MRGILRPGDPGKHGEISMSDVPEHIVQHGSIHIAQSAEMGRSQDIPSAEDALKAHISHIEMSTDKIEIAKSQMEYPEDLPSFVDDDAGKRRYTLIETSKHNIRSNLEASIAAACDICINTPGAGVAPDYFKIGAWSCIPSSLFIFN